MRDAVRDQYEAFPDPSPSAEPIGPTQLARIDDNLHFGWSWHRHRFSYRRPESLRILDAGCGTGLTTLGLARLNPGSAVRGVDASPKALDLARQRATAAHIAEIEFAEHDLETPLPTAWGTFDFVVCRHVLEQAEDPVLVLRNLAAALDHRGLLLATFPSRFGRLAPRQMRHAIDALAGPAASLEERARVGIELFNLLRPDHPIRRDWTTSFGTEVPGVDRFVAHYLGALERDFELSEAIALVEAAGFQTLVVPSRWPWQANRVFAGGGVPGGLQKRVDQLSPGALSELIEALDPVLHAAEYRIYACLAEYEPRVPLWPETAQERPETIDDLIPHRSGLAEPVDPPRVTPAGAVTYASVTGAMGEIERSADLAFRAINGRSTCAEINRVVSAQTGIIDDSTARRDRWLNLANSGIVILESPDIRQNVDCSHLGKIVDRLDCACPRRWVRECDLHGHCTIARVEPSSPTYPAYQRALQTLGLERTVTCSDCPDYQPED